jgi:putative transposase
MQVSATTALRREIGRSVRSDSDGWDDVDQLELATLSGVHWFNEHRLHSHSGDVPPAESEAAFYAAPQAYPTGVGIQ